MSTPWPGRVVSATPEIVASASYFAAWVAPASVAPAVLRSLVLAMLVEFLVVHSSGFLSAFLDRDAAALRRPLPVLLGLAAVYLLFAGAFGLAFGSWMPVWVIGWLIGSRVLTVVADPRGRADESARQRALWVSGAVLYLMLAFVTAIAPIPAFGIDAAARARMDLPGSGLWIDQPQRPIAMGAFYFGLLAAVELLEWGLPAARGPAPALRPRR